MSKVGKVPITIPEKVTVAVDDALVRVKGDKQELMVDIPKGIKVEVKENQVLVTRQNESKIARSLHGLVRSLVNNAIEGVSRGFSKTLEIQGVGYKAEIKNDRVVLHIGFSHPVEVPIVEGVEIKQEKNTLIISGADKQKVGHMAALIRSKRKPEPYKGKGIRYSGEIVRRKAGKAAKTAAA